MKPWHPAPPPPPGRSAGRAPLLRRRSDQRARAELRERLLLLRVLPVVADALRPAGRRPADALPLVLLCAALARAGGAGQAAPATRADAAAAAAAALFPRAPSAPRVAEHAAVPDAVRELRRHPREHRA
eukprot:5893897-Prymnesium_polylepis.1